MSKLFSDFVDGLPGCDGLTIIHCVKCYAVTKEFVSKVHGLNNHAFRCETTYSMDGKKYNYVSHVRQGWCDKCK